MFIEKFVSEGLAHFSYIVGNDNDAFVVDPKRDVDSYIQIAKSNCCRIRFVFETHCNEDYLIGSLELERLTGCKIIHSDRLDFGYGEPSTENDTFDTSGMRVRVIETPGHSPESLSFVLYSCLLYTSDAADDLLCVDLGGRRIIKKKKKNHF